MRKGARLSGLRSKVVLALLLGLLLASVQPAVAKKPGWPPGKGEETDEFDTAVGRRLYPLALARGGGEVSLGKSGRYLRTIFDDLAHSARKQRKLDYSLHVLSSRDQLDAWALPDGSVFVTVGLLYRLQTGDEVAGALAHQLAHAVLRHNLDDLTSPEAQELLGDLVEGRIPPVREKLGRYGISLLGEYYPSAEEKAADSLARGLLRQNGFRESGVENSFRRLVSQPLPAYLMAHPHPNLKPLPKERDLPPVIIIEIDEPAPPRPPIFPLPPVRSELPLPPPARIQRVAAPDRPIGLGLLAGVYPVSVAASTTTLQFTDETDPPGTSPLSLQTSDAAGGVALGALVEAPLGRHWEGVFGGGWASANLFAGRPRSNGGFVLAGALKRSSGDGEGIRWAVGPYLSLTWMLADVGRTTQDLFYYGYGGDPPETVEAGTPVTAQAIVPSAGAMLTLSGGTPQRGVSWFVTVDGQISYPGAWSYSAVAYNTQRSVNLPFTGQNAAPLSATGLVALGGVVFRF